MIMKSRLVGSALLAEEKQQSNQRFRVLDLLRTGHEEPWNVSQRHWRQPDQLVRIDLTACRLAVRGMEDRHPLVRITRRGVIRCDLRQPACAITCFLGLL